MDYEKMLDRAYDNMEDIGGGRQERLEIPEPRTKMDGSFTVFRNFSEVAEIMNRDESEVLTFLQDQMATSGSISNNTARFKGNFSEDDLSEYVDEFLEDFVKCNECGSPDTNYEKQSGVQIIRCTACGASNPKPDA